MKFSRRYTALYIGVFLSGILIFPGMLAAKDVRPLSAGWLEQGCLAIMVGETDEKNFTKAQEILVGEFIHWMNGFMVGANAMSAVSREGGESPPLTYPPDEWLDTIMLAPMLLAFINDRKIDRSITARETMAAFYLMNHPKASDKDKFMGEALLRRAKPR